MKGLTSSIGELWDREMARYRSIEIVPREIFVVDHEAAMVWTILASPSDRAERRR